MGESSWEASEILEYLNGKISRDELAQELTGAIDGLTSGLDETRAAITAEETKRADADGALSSRVDTVLATANGAAAGVEETRNALVDVDGKLKATWSIKAQVAKDGKIYAAGMSAGAYSQPDGSMQTAVYFLADRLALLNQANGATTTPFVIENGQTFINEALIGTAKITNAMIQSLDASKINTGFINAGRLDAGVLAAKLATLDSAYIKTAHIGVAQVDTLRIASGAVVVNNSTTFSLQWGRYSGSTTASLSIYLNVPARLMMMQNYEFGIGDGNWAGDPDPRPTLTSNFGFSGNAQSWLSGLLDPGTYTLTITFPRPVNGTAHANGNMALMGLLR
jgi:predicted phage tail protein